jgi:hypothetical protein
MNKLWLSLIMLLLVFNIAAQNPFNIETFTNPEKYGWKNWDERINYRNDLYERQKLLQIYEIDAQSISGNVLKSAVFPGWGQFNARQYTKGQVFLAIEIALLGSSYFFYDRAQDNYNKYNEATQIDQMNAYYRDAQSPYQYSLVFLTFATVVWAYNLFDVVQSTEQYNSDAWEKTLKTYYQAPVKLGPEGIEIEF